MFVSDSSWRLWITLQLQQFLCFFSASCSSFLQLYRVVIVTTGTQCGGAKFGGDGHSRVPSLIALGSFGHIELTVCKGWDMLVFVWRVHWPIHHWRDVRVVSLSEMPRNKNQHFLFCSLVIWHVHFCTSFFLWGPSRCTLEVVKIMTWFWTISRSSRYSCALTLLTEHVS